MRFCRERKSDGCRGDDPETKILVSTGHHDDLTAGRSEILGQTGRDVDFRTVQTPRKAKALDDKGGL